jgi:prolyl-tRNA editing enzyme YbaK/EbsC (Cys-tRNA(Pro) deacylase)
MSVSEQQPRAVAAVVEAGRARGLQVRTREFPDGTRTAGDAAGAIGCAVGQIVKSLVFVADGLPVLVLTSGANRVDVAKVARELGPAGDAGRPDPAVRKADAGEVRDATGFAIGGTPPFGHARELAVLIDQDLTRFDTIWAAAGTPRHVFPLSPAELLRATAGRVCDVAAEPAG